MKCKKIFAESIDVKVYYNCKFVAIYLFHYVNILNVYYGQKCYFYGFD